MDGSGKIDVLKEHEPVGEEIEGEAEEQIEEEEQSSDDYYSYNSTDSSIDLGEYNYLLQERSETLIKTPAVTFESDEEEKDEALKRSKSGTLEILSEQTELSDESAWEREGSKRKHRLTLVENLTEDSLEVIRETQVDLEEATSEQMFGETEEMEEEQLEEEEEEELEPEEYDEWERERKILQFQKDLEEVLNYQFPEYVNDEEEAKLLLYESMLKDLEKDDKEIDIMIKELEKNEKTIHIIDKTLGPLITHYEKEVSAFRKVGDDGFLDLEGEEEEEDVEDESRSRAAEMAKEILEADDIESVGSLGKESSGDDLSNKLSQMALDLKESEPEVEKEDSSIMRKAPTKQRRKTIQSKRSFKQKSESKKKKK